MDDDQTSSSSPFTSLAALSTSRRSSGVGTTSSVAPPTPPPLPNGNYTMKEEEPAEDIGPLDPRRLTPNLHANLVSEILSLRRDVESKDLFIDRLESILASQKSSHEDLEDQLARKSKEARAIKRQLQAIEDGTLSALEELCKERDEANETVGDLKKRLETSQRQLKVEQEKNDHVHKSRDEEKLSWERERSQLQRKNDVIESRLRVVAEELVALQSGGDIEPSKIPSKSGDFAATNGEGGSLPSSPTKVRSHRRNRSSVSTIGSTRPDSMINKSNLFDELDGDGDDTASEGDFHETFEHRFMKSLIPRDSAIPNDPSEKDVGMLSGIEEADEKAANDAQPVLNTTAIGAPYTTHNNNNSVSMSLRREPESTTPVLDHEREMMQREEVAAGIEDRFQKDQTACEIPSEPIVGIKFESLPAVRKDFSPRASPISNVSFVTASSGAIEDKSEMASASTQVNMTRQSTSSTRAARPAPIQVPQISIHPPESGPSSPSETVLPPQTKNVGTQADLGSGLVFRSVAVQTDVIRVDRRLHKLPAHLLPLSLPAGPEPSASVGIQPSSVKIVGANDGRETFPVSSSTDYEGRNLQTTTDESPTYESPDPFANESSWSRFRQTLIGNIMQTRLSEADPFQGNEDTWMSDGESAAPLPPPRTMKRPQKSGMIFDPPTPVPENEKVVISKPIHSREQVSVGNHSSFDRAGINMRSNFRAGTAKGKHARRPSDRSVSPSSMASSSAWSRSTNPPPGVVIPQRTSSVGIRYGTVEGTTSPPRRSEASSPTRTRGAKRIGKPPMLRKIRSASILNSEKRGDASKGLPLSPLSQASFASGEASPAPVPEDSVLEIYRAGHQRSSSSQTRRLSSVHPTGNASVGSSIQHSVVDAISAAMVGEWMWKYVRKQRSFALSNQETAKTGDQRHKRWVWLSPYERAVMWSTKQPTSNSALMGKPGRKLIIQSALDVKDDSIYSRGPGSQGVFNRSILILTPSRALKFTATTRERHYLWLTALSYLAHHTSQGMLDLSFLPRSVASTPYNEPEPNVSRTTSATPSRNGKKPWSSRATNRSQQSSGYATPSIPEAFESGDGAAMPIPPRPTRLAPQAPSQEMLPSDAAFPPNIPRLPDSRSTTAYFGLPTKHGRKRSVSMTGVMSLSSRPSSGRLQANGPVSANSYPTTATGYNSSNLSTKSGINHPSASSARNNASAASPPPPIPSASFAKYFGGSSNRQPGVSGAPDDPEVEAASNRANAGFGPEETRNLDGATRRAKAGSDVTTEFGGNNSFFDAVGTPVDGFGPSSSRQNDTFSGPGFERGIGGPPKRQPPPPPVPTLEVSPALMHGHAHSDSIDSVAPPPIRRRGELSPTSNQPLAHITNGPNLANRSVEDKSGETAKGTKETKQLYQPPQRKRGRWGLAKNSAARKEAGVHVAAARPNVAVLAATADGDGAKVENAHKGGQEII